MTSDVPPSMVEAEFQQIWAQVTADIDAAEKDALEAERADYLRIAERRVRLGLLLSDIGQKNGVSISQQEMNRLVAQEAQRFKGQEREVQTYFAENAMAAAQLRAPLFEEKVVDFLIGKARLTDRHVTREALEEAIASEDETPTGQMQTGQMQMGQTETGHVHGPGCGHDHGDSDDEAAAPGRKTRAKQPVTAEADADAPAKPARKSAAKKPAEPVAETDTAVPAPKPASRKKTTAE